MKTTELVYRPGTAQDALSLSVLATQVFLDTYATSGVSNDLAAEARSVYSPEVLSARLGDPSVLITAVENAGSLVPFLDLNITSECPVREVRGLEVFRLYVQASFQRRGVGRVLMSLAASKAAELGDSHVWLTAWSGNRRALAFYAGLGYQDVGSTQYVIEGKAYENRVLARSVAKSAA